MSRHTDSHAARYELRRHRLDKIPEGRILKELERAAQHFGFVEFGWRDFNGVAGINANTVKKYFGGWRNGLNALRRHLEEKGQSLTPRPHYPNRIYSDNELFDEMERIWHIVGQRPSRTEWEANQPRITYNTYRNRFGGWTRACLSFIEYKMDRSISADDFVIPDQGKQIAPADVPRRYKPEDSRGVPVTLRLRVLSRDNFRCAFCGRSPATDVGVRLHIDHIVAFSRGGKSVAENLQTLCEACNLGKRDASVNRS